MTTSDEDAVAVRYADPSGSARTIRHAAFASIELALRRQNDRQTALSTSRGAYEYGTSQVMDQVRPLPLPEG